MVITDPNSGLPEARPEPPPRYFTQTQNLDRKNLINTMRASSPTRDQTSIKQSHHPSALTMFDSIANNSAGKQIVVFLDYDGTLSPIVDDPDRAFISREMKRAVRNVAKLFPAAIVSGRARAKVHKFVGLPELYYAGSHGMDIMGPSGNQNVLYQPAKEFLPMIDEVQRTLAEKIKYIPGAMVENNKFCLSVHYRRVKEERWIELADKVKSVIEEYKQLRLSSGRKVLDIRPVIKWDKGNAIEFLLESLGYAESNDVFPIYIGDDKTDEDAFRVLLNKGEGAGILVSNVHKETNASYTLQEPSEVMQFLKRLVEWHKRGQIK